VTYLLTFNCYATRFPGDERGSVDRARGQLEPNPNLVQYSHRIMTQEPYQLDLLRAQAVLNAIREVSEYRDWDLLAAHARTTHVHLVADRLNDPDRTITDCKAYASRALTRLGFETSDRMRWSRGGSVRPLLSQQAVSAAIKYVMEQQGEPMAVYRV
jgi:hypothetical protein